MLSAKHAVLADLAVESLLEELELFPKPGLVSPIDSGSHRDMHYSLLRASAESLRESFFDLAEAGAAGADFQTGLVPIGIQAEQHMLRTTGGVNTHRGAIFAMGLLVASAARSARVGKCPEISAIRETLLSTWGQGLRDHASKGPKWSGGARTEAANGFPSIFEIALPHFRFSRLPRAQAALETLFVLLATVEDTNVLHRGGTEGGNFARQQAQSFLAAGGMANPGANSQALAIHHAFIERNLSPGGTADLLAGTLFLDRLTR